MKNFNVNDGLSRLFGGVCGLIGFATLLLSVFFETFLDENSNYNILVLFIAYALILAAIAMIDSTLVNKKRKYTDISILSFYMYGLFIPLALSLIVLIVWNKKPVISFDKVTLICWILHIIALGIWFLQKLIKPSKLRESDLMRLNSYSAILIIPLTLIWVIYRIDLFKLGFAAVMTELMIFQAIINGELIRRKTLQEDNELQEKGLIEDDKK